MSWLCFIFVWICESLLMGFQKAENLNFLLKTQEEAQKIPKNFLFLQ